MHKIVCNLLCLTLSALVMTAEAGDIKRLFPKTLYDSSYSAYSQVVVAPKGHLVFVSGQGAYDAEGNLLPGNKMEDQIPVAIQNLKLAIEAAGARPEHATKMVIAMVDHNEKHLEQLAEELKELFGEHLPAGMLIGVPRLAFDGMRFEMDVTLVIPEEEEK